MTIIDAILKKVKSKSDAAEVFHLRNETTGCSWAADKLKLAETKETSGVAVRVIKDGKIGFFASNKVDDADKIADIACELVNYGSEFAGELPSEYKPVDADFFHESTAHAGAERLIEAGNGMMEKAKSAFHDAIYEGKLDRSIVHCTIANSHGTRADFRKTLFGGFLWGSVTREGDVLNVFEYGNYNYLDNQPESFADSTVQKLKNAVNVVKLHAGEYPCILTPNGMDVFGVLETALNARAVLKDLSPFKDKVGEKIFDEKVILVDDRLRDKMPGSQPVDDEGVTSQKTVLVENGILKSFIHDLHTAAKMNVAPTGNGERASLNSGPKAGFTTFAINPGTKTLDEMISGIKKGVLIDNVMGAHQASAFSGDYSVNIGLGYVIEDGKIIGRFKDGMLAGNVFRMLKEQILEIGSEPKFVGILFPPILFDRMTISTTG